MRRIQVVAIVAAVLLGSALLRSGALTPPASAQPGDLAPILEWEVESWCVSDCRGEGIPTRFAYLGDGTFYFLVESNDTTLCPLMNIPGNVGGWIVRDNGYGEVVPLESGEGVNPAYVCEAHFERTQP